MIRRQDTKKIKLGSIEIGGSSKVLIQSMCDTKTSNINEIIKEINDCAVLGADLMRVSILDNEDAEAIKTIKENINIPLVGDIHFSTDLALKAIENGIDKIRINPINTPKEQLIKIIDSAKKHNVVIRIGLNEGSTTKDGHNIHNIEDLISLTRETIEFLEAHNFYDLVLSVKSSSALKTIAIYKELANNFAYPLHVGVTESGFDDIGIIRSTIGISNILLEGIGNTIRVSLTKDPKLEIITAKRMLHDLNLYPNYPTLISCPTCGRCKVNNIKEIAQKVMNYLETNNKNISFAVMGCIVNGIGEGKNADIGIAGADHKFIIFKKGEIIKTVEENNLFDEVIQIINSF